MGKFYFRHALLPNGWHRDVLIDTDGDGRILSVTPGAENYSAAVTGHIVVPGIANLHSHTFQRAMAGLSEWRGENANDSFWTWREVMYRFVERLTPDDLQSVAAQLYVEMAESGFTAVGEFHYLHHQPNGLPYDNLAEMSGRLAAAAADTGIAMTLLPVFYHYGGFGGAEIGGAQRRFDNDPDRFVELVAVANNLIADPRTIVGIAPHSLRAVTPNSLAAVVDSHLDGPIHIHVAEQEKEVRDCLQWSGARPVAWLLDHHDLNRRWCLIHATHMNDDETTRLAQSGAVAGLCPITEANLGDGIFNGVSYQHAGGTWGIGSDSHIRIDLAEELRSLEYSQRLRDRARVRLSDPAHSNGRSLFDRSANGGARAIGQLMGRIEPGAWADFVTLDANHPTLVGCHDDDIINGWIFAGDGRCVRDVWISGRQVVADGRHFARETIRLKYSKTIRRLKDG